MVWYATIGLYLWDLFRHWLGVIFVAPFKTTDMLWLLVPVWLSWFFAEFFQEKHGTSLGNAMSNAMVVLWGGIDYMRQTVNLISTKLIAGFGTISLRFLIASVIFVYGLTIVILGWRANPLIKKIARVRVVTYVFAMTAPIMYGTFPLTFNHFVASLIYFPLFYFTIEFVDQYTPNPKLLEEDEGKSSLNS